MASLRVIEIFDSLQGEGYWTGVPMTFVRLAGCNALELGLECADWCDTRASWDPGAGAGLDVKEVVRRVRLPRLCLTGGEPLLQIEGVAELVAAAHEQGIRVHLETNGTVDPFVPSGAALDFDWAVVSPKPPDYAIASGWGDLVDELKLVFDDHLDAATAERLAEAHLGAFVSIQPAWRSPQEIAGAGADSASAPGAVERAVALVMSHPEWRLSLQAQKFLGIR